MSSRLLEDQNELLMVFLVLILSTCRVVTASIVVGLAVVATLISGDAGRRSDSDVLAKELLSGKVVHEVLGSDVASVLIVVFSLDSVQLLDDRLRDLLE